MDKICNISVEPLQDARFVKPCRLLYTQNDVEKNWEIFSIHSIVSVLIFNSDIKKVVLVQQFRPAVYLSHYPRNEREIELSSTVTNSAATQSHTSPQSTQQTQTVQQILNTQETQTVAETSSNKSDASTISKNNTTASSTNQLNQATQSVEVVRSNKSIQSDAVEQCSQSSQSGGITLGTVAQSCSSDTAESCLKRRKALSTLPASLGITLELCAGIVDKNLPIKQIAKEEVLEECGYDVALDELEEIVTFCSNKTTVFFAEVTNKDKVGAGGGLASEGEIIDVVEMSIPEIKEFLTRKEVNSPSGMLYALMWFLNNKAHLYQ